MRRWWYSGEHSCFPIFFLTTLSSLMLSSKSMTLKTIYILYTDTSKCTSLAPTSSSSLTLHIEFQNSQVHPSGVTHTSLTQHVQNGRDFSKTSLKLDLPPFFTIFEATPPTITPEQPPSPLPCTTAKGTCQVLLPLLLHTTIRVAYKPGHITPLLKASRAS